ncbi:MAG: bifunctional folylpolyglutamate synthase/dihydrofolate synthase [Weeksellaceae bacterium]
MNYEESIEWLFQQLPIYQKIGKTAYKDNLNNITALCEHLGNPQNTFKSIHVAGTNGKGSTSHMIASILQESGYKTGLHTSPHLLDFRERTRVNGEIMGEDFVKLFIREHKEFIESLHASFFEVSVAMAFQYFADNKIDIAVIETGLGGRLDATNIINPELSIITNVGLDHTAILGETLQDIALEKAGIIKDLTPVIIGEYEEDIKDEFEHKAKIHEAPIYFGQEMDLPFYDTDLKGTYQKLNTRTAAAASKILQKQGWTISDENIANGLKHVVQNTGLRGRWDILQQNPLIVADTAHNAAGIKHVVEQIQSTKHDQLHLVLGFVNDKDVNSILNLLPEDAVYYFAAPNIPRKMEIASLQNLVKRGLKAHYFNSVPEALNQAKKDAKPEDFIYIGGSTFVVAEALDIPS